MQSYNVPTRPTGLRRFARWLTGRRIRGQAIVLALCLWSVFAIDFATPGLIDLAGNVKFQDFLPFYVSGVMVSQGRTYELYEPAAVSAEMRSIVPQSAKLALPVVYGPQVGLFFSSFSHLSFFSAALLWTFFSILVCCGCCYVLSKACIQLKGWPWLLGAVTMAFPPLFHLAIRGQIAALLLACFTGAFFAFRAGHSVLAGLILGSLIFKPQFAIAIFIVLLAAGAWKSFLGATIAAVGQLALAWIWFGSSVMYRYVDTLTHLPKLVAATEPNMSQAQMHSLRSFWSLIVPWPEVALGLYVLSSITVLVLAVQSWKSAGAFSLRFSALIMAAVLVNPHLFVYDLIVLVPALLLLADWTLQNPLHPASMNLRVLLYCSYLLPLFGPFAILTHLQFSVLAFTGLQWLLWRILRSPNYRESTASAEVTIEAKDGEAASQGTRSRPLPIRMIDLRTEGVYLPDFQPLH